MPNNVVEKTKKALGNLIHGTRELADPDSVDSQVQDKDLESPEHDEETPDPNDADEKLIALGNKRYEEARLGRYEHHTDIFNGLAMFSGNQYDVWNNKKSQFERPETVKNNPFLYRYHNIIRVLIERAVARITAGYPDAWAAPLTDSDSDKKAAQVARSINAHCTHLTRRQQLIADAVLAMLITSTVFIECGWDAKADADVALPQADGSTKYERAPIGDVHNGMLLSIDAYPDPNSALSNKGIHGGAYFIKKSLRSVGAIAHKWGKTVNATASTGGTYQSLHQRVQWLAGDVGRQAPESNNAAEVTEVWELPNDQYPDGRFWVYCGDIMLHKGKWPYEKKDEYPFVDLYYQKNFGSVWGLNMATDLASVQQEINKVATYLHGRTEWDVPTAWVEEGSRIDIDDVLDPMYGRVSTYARGSKPPVYTMPPPPGSFYFDQIKSLMDTAEYIAGVHDLGADSANPPESGYQFDLMMQEDKSRLGPVIRRVEQAVVNLYEWDLSHYRQFGASFPRMMALEDTSGGSSVPSKSLDGTGGNPAAAGMVDLAALKAGQCRVVLQPGSGEAKLPAAQEEELQELVKILATLPPPIAELYLNNSNTVRTDALKDRVIAGMQKIADQEAASSAANVAAQNNSAAAQQQGAEHAAQAASQASEQQADQQKLETQIAADQQESQIQLQADAEKSAIAVHASSLEQQWRMQADQANLALQAGNALKLQQAKSALPTVSGTFTLGTNATISEEKKLGLTPDDPAEQQQMNNPPPPVQVQAKPKPKAKTTP